MYQIKLKKDLRKKLKKIYKKDIKKYQIIIKKLKEIKEHPHRYKNLRKPLNNLKRVHIDKHFVLTFSVNEKNKTILIEDFENHNKIYRLTYFFFKYLF